MKRLALTGALLLTATLAACDLPGAHQNEAAVVNGHSIPRSTFDHLVQVTTQQLKQHIPVDTNSDNGRQQVRNLQVQALRALVRQEVIQELAAARHVSVTDAEIDAQVAQLTKTLGGETALNQRLDKSDETRADLRNTIRINLLQSKLRQASSAYDGEYKKAVADARVSAYAPPCESDHNWPQCTGGQR